MSGAYNPHYRDFHNNFDCEHCGFAPSAANKPAYKEWSKRVFAHHGFYPPGQTLRYTDTVPAATLRKMAPWLGEKDEFGGDKPSYSAEYGPSYPEWPCEHCPAMFHRSDSRESHVEEAHPKEYEMEQYQKEDLADYMARQAAGELTFREMRFRK